MKKIIKITLSIVLVCSALAALLVPASCTPGDHTIYYEYFNATDQPVTMQGFYQQFDGELNRSFKTVIQPGKMCIVSEEVYQGGENYCKNYPDHPYLKLSPDKFVIDNQLRVVTYQSPKYADEVADLYDISSFEVVDYGEYNTTYRFTFTDEFFEGGEPM